VKAKKWICASLPLCLVFTLAGAASVSAAPSRIGMSPSGGPIEIFVKVGNGTVGTIVIAGAIGDYGKVLTVGANGKPNPNGHFVDVTLKKGTFKVNKTGLDKASNNPRPTVQSAATCSFGFSATGPITLSGGTGAYAGISGTLTTTLTFGGIGPRYTTGAKIGKCNMSNNAQPLAQFGTAVGHGTIKLS
jgi:hypothetical protein